MPTGQEIKQLLKTKGYDFLRENPFLGDNICYLTVGGSIAYGTNLPEKQSDIDIRGITLENSDELAKSLLDMNHFEQVVENNHEENIDAVIYGFNKIVKLLLSCNPNTIEMLGTKPEHILYINDTGKLLRDNIDLFLSKKAIGSFGGYAGQQLNRMLNALARDRLEQREKEEHILRSIKSAMGSFNDRYRDFNGGCIDLYIADSKKENLDSEIFANINLNGYPLRDFNSILNELGSISRTYNKINHRNHKKDDAHLNKHAMHLVRLYLMAIDILDSHKVQTFRQSEQQMLLDIRRGKYMKEDGTYKKEFFDLVESLEKKFFEAAKNTTLPDFPDYKKVAELTKNVHLGQGVNEKDIITEIFDER
jgi:predicted nucleotidyltransferase